MNKSIGVAALTAIMLCAYMLWQGRAANAKVGSLLLEFPIKKRQYSFVMFGDYGTGSAEQMSLFQAVENHCSEFGIDAIFLLGDNIYMDGAAHVHDPKFKAVIEKPFSLPCISQVPLYPLLGNHDYKGNANAQIEYTKINPQWNFPHRFYSVNFNNLIEVIALDTNYLDYCGNNKSCGLDFFLDRKKNSLAKWKIALGHHPVTSSSSKHGSGLVGKVMEWATCGIQAYISAHSHHLEHLKSAYCNTDLFVSGAGGAHLYPIKNRQNDSRFALAQYGFLTVSASQMGINYQFIDTSGNLVYQHAPIDLAQTP